MSQDCRKSSRNRGSSPPGSIRTGVQTRSTAERHRGPDSLSEEPSAAGVGPSVSVGSQYLPQQLSQPPPVSAVPSVSAPGPVPVSTGPVPVTFENPIIEMTRIAAAQVSAALSVYRPPKPSDQELDDLVARMMPRVLQQVELYVSQRLESHPVVDEPRTTAGFVATASQTPASQGIPRLPPPQAVHDSGPLEYQRDHNDDAARWLALTQRNVAEDTSHPSEWRGPEYYGLPERKTRRAEFQHVISYRAYRLRNRDNNYDATIADKIADMAKRLKPSMQCPNFSGEDEIAVLGFLKNYKRACDDTGTSEGAALPLLRYFLAGGALSSFNKYVGPGLRNSTPGVDCIRSYPEAVYWLLYTYATDKVLKKAYEHVTHMRQGPNEEEMAFGERLREEAIRCGDVFDDGALIQVYVDGLTPAVSHVMNDLLEEAPDMSFQKVKTRAQSRGDALRAGMPSRTSPYAGLSPIHPRNTYRAARSPQPAHKAAMLVESDYEQVDDPEAYALPIETGSAYSQSLPSLPSGFNSRMQSPGGSPARPSSPHNTTSGSNGPYRRAVLYRCHACKMMGHSLLDCPLLTEEQKRRFREAHERARALERPQSAGSRRSTTSPSHRGGVLQMTSGPSVSFQQSAKQAPRNTEETQRSNPSLGTPEGKGRGMNQ